MKRQKANFLEKSTKSDWGNKTYKPKRSIFVEVILYSISQRAHNYYISPDYMADESASGQDEASAVFWLATRGGKPRTQNFCLKT